MSELVREVGLEADEERGNPRRPTANAIAARIAREAHGKCASDAGVKIRIAR